MCMGFGIIVSHSANGELYLHFCEPTNGNYCSHSEILERLGWDDNQDRFNRKFVRVEFWNWKPQSFRFDEDYSLPSWAEENRQEIADRSEKLLLRVAASLEPYFKDLSNVNKRYQRRCVSHDKSDEKALDKIRDKLASEKAAARNSYYKGLTDYSSCEQALCKANTEFNAQSSKQYNRMCKIKHDSYLKYSKELEDVRIKMANAVRHITGYVPEKGLLSGEILWL